MRATILLINQYFYPEPSATGQLLEELAAWLVKEGYEVTVICGRPSFHERLRVPKVERHKGVLIRRVWTSVFSKTGFLGIIGRLANFATFYLSSSLTALKIPKHDIVVTVTNPPFLGIVGVLVKTFRGSRFLYIIHDVYPDVAVKTGAMFPGLLASLFSRLSGFLLRQADSVVVLERRTIDVLNGHWEGLQQKAVVIPNWTDASLIVPPTEEERQETIARWGFPADSFVVQYSGNMGIAHEFATLLHAADRLRDHNQIRFLFVGEGIRKPELIREVERLGLRNVTFRTYEPKGRLSVSLGSADVSVVTMRQGVEGTVVPSKVYNILASGRPILAIVGGESEVTDVIIENQCGTIVPVGDVEAATNAILCYYRNPGLMSLHGTNARKAAELYYCSEVVLSEYSKLVAKLLGAPVASN